MSRDIVHAFAWGRLHHLALTVGVTATGLDHAGFLVQSRVDVEARQGHLEAHGVIRADVADKPMTQSPIADESYGSVLVFRDPDNIQLELFSPAAH